MTQRSLTPEHVETLFLQVRAMHRYLGLLKRRLIDLKLMLQEPELFEYLSEAAESIEYLSCFFMIAISGTRAGDGTCRLPR